MMVSKNLALVRSIFTGWERGDYTSTGWVDPDIEFVFADGPDPGSWSGLAATVEVWREFLSAWEGHRSEAMEFREIDSERVCALLHISARGTTSGVETGQRAASVFTLRSGKVTRLAIYWDSDNALADLGHKE